jgi:hypothetical protein
MSDRQRCQQLKRNIDEANELLSELEARITVENRPVERHRLELDLAHTREHIAVLQREWNNNCTHCRFPHPSKVFFMALTADALITLLLIAVFTNLGWGRIWLPCDTLEAGATGLAVIPVILLNVILYFKRNDSRVFAIASHLGLTNKSSSNTAPPGSAFKAVGSALGITLLGAILFIGVSLIWLKPGEPALEVKNFTLRNLTSSSVTFWPSKESQVSIKVTDRIRLDAEIASSNTPTCQWSVGQAHLLTNQGCSIELTYDKIPAKPDKLKLTVQANCCTARSFDLNFKVTP